MNGYLRRLVTRTSVPSGFQPQVRSASPIAQDDQRLGMPGFEEPPLAADPLIDDALDGSMLAASPRASASPEPARVRRGPGEIHPAPAAPPISTAPQARERAVIRELPPEFPRDYRGLTPRRSVETASVDRPMVHPAPSQRGAAPDAFDLESETTTRMEVPQSVGAASESPATSWDSMEEVQAPFLEPAPQPIPAASAAHSRSDQDTALEASDDREPRIVIGRINVEVIPATPAQPKTEPARPKPLTAAAASVIGPLSNSIRSSRLLNLRYR